MRQLSFILLLLLMVVTMNGCRQNVNQPLLTGPVALPDPKIPGFHFPENPYTIQKWITTNDTCEIYKHAWGLWAAVTMNACEADTTLLVYETWLSVEEIKAQTATGDTTAKLLKMPRPGRAKLAGPGQFRHLEESPDSFTIGPNPSGHIPTQIINDVMVYNDAAAQFTIANRLMDTTTLGKLYRAKTYNNNIPDFPASAVALKPTYMILHPDFIDTLKGLYVLRVWTGPNYDPKGFGPAKWHAWIYIDTTNNGKGDGSVDSTGIPTPQTTYNLKDFIHYKIGVEGVEATIPNADEAVGSYAILVGMHITTKEIPRWTWQTFWWTPDVNNLFFPALPVSVTTRPAKLNGAAAHYTVSAGYTYILPDQPLTNGTNEGGTSLYVYNPYLEAVMNAKRLAIHPTVGGVTNSVGSQTNCMSCHAYANFDPTGDLIQVGLPYCADGYVDVEKDPALKNKLKLDFLWSLQDEAFKKPNPPGAAGK